jgi:hypothetical protein
MDTGSLLRVSIPLVALGFLTGMTASLSVSGIINGDGTRYFLLVVYLLFAIACAFFALWQNPVALSRVTFLILAFLDLTSAIAVVCVSYGWHVRANYVNRALYFFFLLLALAGSIAAFWHCATRLIAPAVLEVQGLDKAEESFLYLV